MRNPSDNKVGTHPENAEAATIMIDTHKYGKAACDSCGHTSPCLHVPLVAADTTLHLCGTCAAGMKCIDTLAEARYAEIKLARGTLTLEDLLRVALAQRD